VDYVLELEKLAAEIADGDIKRRFWRWPCGEGLREDGVMVCDIRGVGDGAVVIGCWGWRSGSETTLLLGMVDA
jgi:hypothetical protein